MGVGSIESYDRKRRKTMLTPLKKPSRRSMLDKGQAGVMPNVDGLPSRLGPLKPLAEAS